MILKFYRFILISFTMLMCSTALFAGETLEIPSNQDDLNLKLIALLGKLDSKYYLDDKTRGFTYRYRNKWNDPFDYNIYISKVGKNSPDSLLRIEAPRVGQERFFRQIFEQEILLRPARENAVALEKKSLLLSQGLNLISPMASVGYNSWNSPIYTNRDTLISMAVYFVMDLFIAGGAYYYAEQKLPKKNIWDNIANTSPPNNVLESADAITFMTALAISRGIRAFDAWEDTAIHNRAANFSWKFQF